MENYNNKFTRHEIREFGLGPDSNFQYICECSVCGTQTKVYDDCPEFCDKCHEEVERELEASFNPDDLPF